MRAFIYMNNNGEKIVLPYLVAKTQVLPYLLTRLGSGCYTCYQYSIRFHIFPRPSFMCFKGATDSRTCRLFIWNNHLNQLLFCGKGGKKCNTVKFTTARWPKTSFSVFGRQMEWSGFEPWPWSLCCVFARSTDLTVPLSSHLCIGEVDVMD